MRTYRRQELINQIESFCNGSFTLDLITYFTCLSTVVTVVVVTILLILFAATPPFLLGILCRAGRDFSRAGSLLCELCPSFLWL